MRKFLKYSHILFLSILFLSSLVLSFGVNISKIDEFSKSYSREFQLNNFNVSSITTNFLDLNSNSISDVLEISYQINTDLILDDYISIITIYDENSLIYSKPLLSNDFVIEIDTMDFTQKLDLQYVIEIRNQDFELMFRSNILNITNTEYEGGLEINELNIYENNGDLFLDINIEMSDSYRNLKGLEVHDFLIPLSFDLEEDIELENYLTHDIENELFYIYYNTTFTTSKDSNTQIISVPISDSIIENLRGNEFRINLSEIKINQKNFEKNFQSQNFQFENKLPQYRILDIGHEIKYESDDNNSIEEISFILEFYLDNTYNYELFYQLRNQKGVEISSNRISDFTSLSNNLYSITFSISNEELFEHNINSEILISSLLLYNSETGNLEDSLSNSYYTDFVSLLDLKIPDLADLNVDLDTQYDLVNKKSLIDFEISNSGLKDSYNLNVQLYEGSNLLDEILIPYLKKNSSIDYSYEINDSKEGNLYTIIVDPNNLVIEENEFNNFDQKFAYLESSIDMDYRLNQLDSSILEINIENTGKFALYNSQIEIEDKVINLNILDVNESNRIFVENFENNITYDINFSSDKYQFLDSFTYNLDNPKILLSHIELEENIIQFEFRNIENINKKINFLNRSFDVLGNSKKLVFIEFESFTNEIIYEVNGYEYSYNLSSQEKIESFVDIKHSILNNSFSDNLIIEFDFENTLTYNRNFKLLNQTFEIPSLGSKLVFVELDEIPSSLNVVIDGISYEYDFENSSNDNIDNNVELSLLDFENNQYIYEIEIENIFDTLTYYELEIDDKIYVFKIDPKSKKKFYFQVKEEVSTSQISKVELSNYVFFQELGGSGLSIYELVFNANSRAHSALFNLGDYSYQLDNLNDERKVVYIENNQTRLDINNIILKINN